MLNLSKDLATPQGLNKEYKYEAIVVKNDDSQTDNPYTCRIQARIAILFDGIEDDHLPWAIPFFEHADGASSESGKAFVPKVGSKVLLTFQEGRENFPIWSGYTVDKGTSMPEMKHNYPDRVIVQRLKNKAITLYDTKTNELFIRNPGDLKIYIDGNTELTVTGNVREVIQGNKEVFIEGDYTESIKGNVTRINGGTNKESISGEASISVGGDYAESINGNVTRANGGTNKESVGGAASMSVGGNWKHSTGAASSIQVAGTQVNNAAQMNDQVGGPSPDSPDSPESPDSTKTSPDLTQWPGFPGGAKGT